MTSKRFAAIGVVIALALGIVAQAWPGHASPDIGAGFGGVGGWGMNERLIAGGFNPQPEPPGRVALKPDIVIYTKGTQVVRINLNCAQVKKAFIGDQQVNEFLGTGKGSDHMYYRVTVFDRVAPFMAIDPAERTMDSVGVSSSMVPPGPCAQASSSSITQLKHGDFMVKKAKV
jgi:hypothetical protein